MKVVAAKPARSAMAPRPTEGPVLESVEHFPRECEIAGVAERGEGRMRAGLVGDNLALDDLHGPNLHEGPGPERFHRAVHLLPVGGVRPEVATGLQGIRCTAHGFPGIGDVEDYRIHVTFYDAGTSVPNLEFDRTVEVRGRHRPRGRSRSLGQGPQNAWHRTAREARPEGVPRHDNVARIVRLFADAAKVNGVCHFPRMLESTMAQVSGSLPSPTSRGSTRWAALRPTRQFRRRLFQASIVTVLFLAFVGGLTVLFGTIILQYAVGGLVVSSIVIVAAIGLTVLYGIRGFANFAYGDLMTLGAFLALLLSLNGLSLIWGAIVSFLVLAVTAVLLEIVIFSRLEGRGPVPPIVASVGVALIIQNGIRAVTGTTERIYPVPAIENIVIVPGLGIHPISGILTLVVGISFVLSAHVLRKYTNLGKAMRATADNLELAKATGIDTKRVTYAAWVVSSSFASTAGILLGLGTAVKPTMGFDVLLLIFAAVIVGGIGSPYGAMLGGLMVGLSQEMSVPFLVWLERPDVIGLQFGSAYKVAIPFIILIIVLIFRPWGIAGRRPAFARRSYFIARLIRTLAGWPGAIETSAGEANGGR